MIRFLLAIVLFALPVHAQDLKGAVHVVDGDTLRMDGGVKIRLHGIDAPEMRQTCRTASGARIQCGKIAAGALVEMTKGRVVQCVGQGDDRYGRVVAKCHVNGADLGQAMVQNGFAKAYRKYAMDYVADEKSAAIGRVGLWATTFLDPAIFRANQGAVPMDAACKIKGNISRSSRQRIYHMPGQRDYARTRINTTQGERCFETEQAAQAAGWRRALR